MLLTCTRKWTKKANTSTKPRSCRLNVEELEPRQLLSGFQPTATETLLLEQLNDARANPAAYGTSIGVDLSNIAPSQPLAFNTGLVQSARQHSQDMNDRNYYAHNTPDGVTPDQRIGAAGVPFTFWGESIDAFDATPDAALADLIRDNGVPDLAHRNDLLNVNPLFKTQNQVGTGIVQNGSGQYHNYYTIDTAATTDTRSFITGVIFNDNNHTGKYGVGEGIGGVTISVAGVGTFQDFDAGAYAIQVNPGTYTVTISGGGLAHSVTQTVTVGTTNARLNFAVSANTQTGSTTAVSNGSFVATGADLGGSPLVKQFDANTGALIRQFYAYDPAFMGGVRVTVGDVLGNGTQDIITVPGPGGGPLVEVFDGNTGTMIKSFFAYDPHFTGGAYLAAGDTNHSGHANIVVGADQGGGPNVVIFDGKDNSILQNFFAYNPHFTGGVRVACGDVNGDGYADIICGAGVGGGPNVSILSGKDGSLLNSFFAYNPLFAAGIYVAAADVNGDGHADVICGAGFGGGPNVSIFSGKDGSEIASYFAYDTSFTGGVRVGAATASNGQTEVVTAPGAGTPEPVHVYAGASTTALDTFFAYDPTFKGGLFAAGSSR